MDAAAAVIATGLSVLLAVAGPAPPSTMPATPATAPRSTSAIDALVIDARVDQLVALEAAVRLRIGACPVSRSDRARPPRAGELFAYLEVQREPDGRTTLRLTLGDARAWVRTIDAAEGDRTREIATTVGNLFAGIEGEDLAPDLRDVPLPPPLRPAAPPVVAPPPVAPAARYEWGLGGEGLVVAGLPPPGEALLAAGGLALRGGVRLRRGALVVAGVRAGMRSSVGHVLTRIRIDVGGGHAWHRGAFALHTTASAVIEPWLVTEGGTVPRGSGRRPVGTLLGGAVRIAPMGRVALAERHLVVGPFVELAGSAMPTGGIARVVTSPDPNGRIAFRAGGLELTAGLSITLWSPR